MKKVTGSSQKKQKFLLLMPIAFFLLAVISFLAVFFSLQGNFFITLEKLPPDPYRHISNYRFIIHVLDGLQMRSLEFARYYGSHDTHSTFSPDKKIQGEVISVDPKSHQKILAVWGKNNSSNPVLALIKYANGELEVLESIYGFGYTKIDFSADQIFLRNLDEDPSLEVVEINKGVNFDGTKRWDITRFDLGASGKAYIETEVTSEPRLTDVYN